MRPPRWAALCLALLCAAAAGAGLTACRRAESAKNPVAKAERIVLDYNNGWYHPATGRRTIYDIADDYERDPQLVADLNRTTPGAVPPAGMMIYIPPTNNRAVLKEVVARVRANPALIPRTPWTTKRASPSTKIVNKTAAPDLKAKVGTAKAAAKENPQPRAVKTAKAPSGPVASANLAAVVPSLSSGLDADGPGSGHADPRHILFRWPVKGDVVTKFKGGWRNSCHGIEIAVDEGAPVMASRSGSVLCASEFPGYGKLVVIDHEDGFFSSYGYNERILVKSGDHVREGQKIALAGRESRYSSAKLFFQIRRGGVPVDPLDYMQ